MCQTYELFWCDFCICNKYQSKMEKKNQNLFFFGKNKPETTRQNIKNTINSLAKRHLIWRNKKDIPKLLSCWRWVQLVQTKNQNMKPKSVSFSIVVEKHKQKTTKSEMETRTTRTEKAWRTKGKKTTKTKIIHIRKWTTTNKLQNIDALVKNKELLQQRTSDLLSQNDQTAEESTEFFLLASISWVVVLVLIDWSFLFFNLTFTGFAFWFWFICFDQWRWSHVATPQTDRGFWVKTQQYEQEKWKATSWSNNYLDNCSGKWWQWNNRQT